MNRMEEMLEKHGEVCTRTEAAEILRCHYNTVRALIGDGKLMTACQGSMVDVRSIVAYIEDRGGTRRTMKPRGFKRRDHHAGDAD